MIHKKVIGIFGSSFDPIHIGHLRLVEKVQQVMNFDEIRMVLTGRPPHKRNSAISIEDRWRMLCLACNPIDYLVPESFDVIFPSPAGFGALRPLVLPAVACLLILGKLCVESSRPLSLTAASDGGDMR